MVQSNRFSWLLARGDTNMKALMLAAGVGLRLAPDSDDGHPPKALLPFDDKTLLHRHVEILLKFGI